MAGIAGQNTAKMIEVGTVKTTEEGIAGRGMVKESAKEDIGFVVVRSLDVRVHHSLAVVVPSPDSLVDHNLAVEGRSLDFEEDILHAAGIDRIAGQEEDLHIRRHCNSLG